MSAWGLFSKKHININLMMTFEENINSCLERVLWGFIQPVVINLTLFQKKEKKPCLYITVLIILEGKRRENLFSVDTFRQENVMALRRAS